MDSWSCSVNGEEKKILEYLQGKTVVFVLFRVVRMLALQLHVIVFILKLYIKLYQFVTLATTAIHQYYNQ